MDRYSIIIASDSDHEKVFAEVHYRGKFIALVSQEDGLDQLKVELPGPDLDESQVLRTIALADFILVLETAAKKLIG